jgi:hypothetical protein
MNNFLKMLKSKKTLILCGAPTLSVLWLSRPKTRKKIFHVQNVPSRYVPSSKIKLIRAKHATLSLKTKLNLGKIIQAFKDAKSVFLLWKRYQDAITCHVLYVAMNGAGSVAQTTVRDILTH